jgi:hypothetical protein
MKRKNYDLARLVIQSSHRVRVKPVADAQTAAVGFNFKAQGFGKSSIRQLRNTMAIFGPE